MEDSILNDVKRILGLTPDYEPFDAEIILHVNSVFMILNQLGVGPTSGFRIKDATTLWTEYLPEGDDLEAVKTYMGLKVKMIFDPPSGSTAMEALKSVCSELEWRLNVQVEKLEKEVSDDDVYSDE